MLPLLNPVVRRLPAYSRLTWAMIDEDLRALNATGRILGRTALRVGWRAAGATARGVRHLGRRILGRSSG
ncbi:MAG: hypothetical protein QN114_03460 [Armatimonadota bacterium]|nr:hypothetical protein [Armatimonadota bacterium]MDR7572404.1 hypothetical protein [Armatimonadota bacterium]